MTPMELAEIEARWTPAALDEVWEDDIASRATRDVPVLIAQVKRLTDDPAKDDTDEAHPAWWRGYNADKGELACLTDVARAEARAAHAKVALLEAERDEARSKQRFAEFDASRLRAENATLRSSTEPTR